MPVLCVYLVVSCMWTPQYLGEQFRPCLDFMIGTAVPYFFSYKTEFFSIQNNPKDLDPSCKMDLDLWGCLGRAKLIL